jgi:RNA polymerase sigma-54 factor
LLENLDLLATKNFKQLKKNLEVDDEKLKSYVKKLTALTPKPGLVYGADKGVEVTPDVIIKKNDNGNLKVELNLYNMPKVALSGDYRRDMFSVRSDKKFITEKMSRANWLLKSLQQRQETIYKTATALLSLQRNFFLFGPEGLQPLTLKQVADQIGMHESTVSRISNEKYVQTEFGVFQLKYFFASGVAASAGSAMVGAEAVKSMIKRIVETEEQTKPYSDEKLVALLAGEGVELARRTVAKYRESLNIPSSSKRRVRI